MKKNLILLLVIAALVVLGVWYLGSAKKETVQQAPEDSTIAINQDLNGVDLGDLESEFKDVEQALGTL